jgi:ribosome-binding factor A
VCDETGAPASLNEIDETPDMSFINVRAFRAQQNAGGIGAFDRMREQSFELRRRLRRKLKIQPAPRLDFAHDHGFLHVEL